MDDAKLLPFDLPAVARQKLTVDFDGGNTLQRITLNCFAPKRQKPIMRRLHRVGSWSTPRRVIARIEISLQPDPTPAFPEGMRQAVDIRYVVTSLEGVAERHYEGVYCQRGQAENLIKLHKAQLASDRTSCHAATANQVRLTLHTAAFWLMHTLRAAIPAGHALAKAEFNTLRLRLLKIAASVVEHASRIRVHLPASCPDKALLRQVVLSLTPLSTA